MYFTSVVTKIATTTIHNNVIKNSNLPMLLNIVTLLCIPGLTLSSISNNPALIVTTFCPQFLSGYLPIATSTFNQHSENNSPLKYTELL